MSLQIELQNKIFNNKKQALNELAFCHYPVDVVIDGNLFVFEDFMSAEAYLNNLPDCEK